MLGCGDAVTQVFLSGFAGVVGGLSGTYVTCRLVIWLLDRK